MKNEVILLFLIALSLFTMQAVGGYFQIRDYKKAVRRVHKLGNVGIGQKKGSFLSGYLVLIACNSRGEITGMEVMEGLTFLTKFKPRTHIGTMPLAGADVDGLLAGLRQLEPKKRKRMKGYIQALEALEMRLHAPQEPAEAPASETSV